MKIAIDSGPVSGGHSWRGIGAHTRELVNYVLKLKPKNLEIQAFDFATAKESQKNDFDLLHFTSFNPYFLSIPFKKNVNKIVLTIHDLIPLIYPKNYAAGVKGRIKFLINRILIKYNVDKIVTISETSKKDIVRFLGISPQKVEVVYLASREIFNRSNNKSLLEKVRSKYNLPKKFGLYVGDVNYNKNIPTMIKACKQLNLPLVICGKQALQIESRVNINEFNGPMDYLRYLFGKLHPEIAHYKELVKSSDGVLRIGFVPDQDLAAIYSLAAVYIQPSYYEGFGLPVLEAMSTGVPVVASKTQALVEIAKDAALYANPYSVSDFASKIKSVVNNETLRRELIKKGFAVSKYYSWEKSANNMLKTYTEVLGK